MAEGGAAAALGNVFGEDSWRVHFRDTMRGGKMHNNWRMAQIHAQEAPDRINELEAWAPLRPHADGKINQRPFGGHTYSRWRTWATAPVSNDPGASGQGRALRHRRPHGVHDRPRLRGRRRVAGALGYFRETGRFVLFRARAIGSRPVDRQGVADHEQPWEYTGDGHALAYDAGAELIDMEFVQFHPTGMVWPPSVRGISCGRRAGKAASSRTRRRALMFRYMPDMFKGDFAETEAESDGGSRVSAKEPPPAGAADARCRGESHHQGDREGRGSPHGGVFLDIASNRADYIKKKLRACTTSSRTGQMDITKEAMEIGPRRTT